MLVNNQRTDRFRSSPRDQVVIKKLAGSELLLWKLASYRYFLIFSSLNKSFWASPPPPPPTPKREPGLSKIVSIFNRLIVSVD